MPARLFRIAAPSPAPAFTVAVLIGVIAFAVSRDGARVDLIGWLILAFIAVTLGSAVIAARRTVFEMSHEGLRIRGDWFGRLVPRGHLRVHEARVVDLRTERALRPLVRLWGMGLPGYSSGWFWIKGGRALVYLTDRRHAVFIPTRGRYHLLLSPEDPVGFIAALRALPE